jgi:amidase
VTDADLMFRPAAELAALVRSGELHAREVVEAALRRIDALNPTYNAFVDVFHDEALAAAAAIVPGDARPLAGVPIAIKNNRPVAGKRWTFASEFFGDFAAPLDAVLVTRLRAAGAIVVGTTTLPEMGIVNTTESRRFGPTRNPWDPARTTGGSSGGAAAAVAAGMLPIAHANDGGGSTRIPAACCGLVGLKAQRGRVTPAPFGGYSFLGIDGAVTRTVHDSALALDVMAGPDVGDVAWATPPAIPFAEQAQAEPRGLKIALTTLSPIADAALDPVYAQAVADAGELLRGLGHTVVEADPPWTLPGLEDLFRVLWAPMISLQTGFAAQIAGRMPSDADLEPLTMALWNQARETDALSYAGAEVQLQAAAKGIVQWSAQYDAVLCPVFAEPQVTLGTIDTCSDDPLTTAFERAGHFTPFTPVSNLTGSPAISLPLYHRDDLGLPVPIQLIGRPEGEGALLALAAQLERALPWDGRRAPVAP